MKQAHLCIVFRSAYDCTNNGVTATADHVLLVVDEGGSRQFESTADLPSLWLTCYRGSMIALPMEPTYGEDCLLRLGEYMFGGNFLWSSDSRFRENVADQPIPVFDRTEGIQPQRQKVFPGAALAPLRSAAVLLEETYRLMSTDSEWASLPNAARYEALLEQISDQLFELGSEPATSGQRQAVQHRLPRADRATLVQFAEPQHA